MNGSTKIEQITKQVTLTPDQMLAAFSVMNAGTVMSVVPNAVRPDNMARHLMKTAAQLIAPFSPDTFRENLAAELARDFILEVETQRLAQMTTAGGIITPNGIPKKG